MSEPLDFQNIQFFGIDKLEPQFDPTVHQYTIYRKSGTEFSFKATLNRPASTTAYLEFPKYHLLYHLSDRMGQDTWSTFRKANVGGAVGESHLTIFFRSMKDYYDDDYKEHAVYFRFRVIASPMSEEAIAACTHEHQHTIEGESWGCAGGSSTTKMTSRCDDCDFLVKEWSEYCD